jgi:hypothetical protein
MIIQDGGNEEASLGKDGGGAGGEGSDEQKKVKFGKRIVLL